MKNKKIAVFFPGIGYHNDKPLLYYARKLAAEAGYEDCKNINYTSKPKKIRGDKEKMKESFETLYREADEALRGIRFDDYDDILFISKSIGTAIAVSYCEKNAVKNVRHILYTPLEETFNVIKEPEKLNAIAFIGSADPWSDPLKVVDMAEGYGIPIHLYEGANHSLETDDTLNNIRILEDVMEKSKSRINS
ncbi:hypothetical protein [Butyrivibrio sp. AD3002]|uniref:hypothetical protein n=1 Tax=Butyrivibrio sp. AD3002 TaxID=1280670 RepID=UPI0003B79EE9|nr:hypothetical protein [Butyrivibrio sp. AD3002]